MQDSNKGKGMAKDAKNSRILADEHKNIIAENQRVEALLRQGDHNGAKALLSELLVGREKSLGPNHPDTLRVVGNLAAVVGAGGGFEEAELLLRRALAGYEKTLGSEHLDTLQIVRNLGATLKHRGEYTGAETLYRRALAGFEKNSVQLISKR
jgi:tetratricopeptide (TPR) repeat protein